LSVKTWDTFRLFLCEEPKVYFYWEIWDLMRARDLIIWNASNEKKVTSTIALDYVVLDIWEYDILH